MECAYPCVSSPCHTADISDMTRDLLFLLVVLFRVSNVNFMSYLSSTPFIHCRFHSSFTCPIKQPSFVFKSFVAYLSKKLSVLDTVFLYLLAFSHPDIAPSFLCLGPSVVFSGKPTLRYRSQELDPLLVSSVPDSLAFLQWVLLMP